MEKIKLFLISEKGKDILVVVIVILVGLGSFGLGRLSKTSSGAGVQIEYLNQAEMNQGASAISSLVEEKNISENSIKRTPTAGKTFFASNRGSKYYSIGCSGGKTIKQENRVYFATASEAEEAGYELSASCK